MLFILSGMIVLFCLMSMNWGNLTNLNVFKHVCDYASPMSHASPISPVSPGSPGYAIPKLPDFEEPEFDIYSPLHNQKLLAGE